MLTLITQWSIGFSLLALLILWSVYWWAYDAMEKTWISRLSCSAMLSIVGALQIWHGLVLASGGSLFDQPGYIALLFASPVAFLGFCHELIQPQAKFSPKFILFFIPVAIGPWLPTSLALPLAFLLGALCATWLMVTLQRFKEERLHFELERFGLLGIGAVACVILLVGLMAPWLGEQVYLMAYANLTALVLAVILWLLLRYQDLLQKAIEVVTTSYSVSTLKNHDCPALIKQLQALLTQKRVYQDESLTLSRLAEALALSPHQTSELINTQFGMSFSRLLRQYRVQAAKFALLQEPNASVLSIGMSVGFSSQSTFYSAFREITGKTPGQYRAEHDINSALNTVPDTIKPLSSTHNSPK